VAEGEQRLVALLVEPLVADRRALDVVVDVAEVLRLGRVAVDRLARQLVDALREGDRQAARRIDLAGQHAGDRLAAAGPRIPGLDHGAHLGKPRHQHRTAGLQHHGGLGVGGGDGVDQGVLVVGQGQGIVLGLGGPLVGEDDDQVGAGGGLGGGGRIGAVVIGEGRAGVPGLAAPSAARRGGRRSGRGSPWGPGPSPPCRRSGRPATSRRPTARRRRRASR
jgi:hypothetical protein